jgi:hypothetical protein
MKPERVCEFLKKVPTSQHYHNSLPFLQTYYNVFILLPSFSFPSRLIILFLFKSLSKQIFKTELKVMSREKRELSMIQVRLLKRRRREVKVDPKLGGQWKEKEKFPLLGGQWNVKEKSFSYFVLSP